MKLSALLLSGFILSMSGQVFANDFPTSARVEFVVSCMNLKGSQNYDSMYNCVCQVDKIAKEMPFERFEFAQTMSVMMKTPGERGGAFRDAPGARGMVKDYKKLLDSSKKSCAVKNIKAQ